LRHKHFDLPQLRDATSIDVARRYVVSWASSGVPFQTDYLNRLGPRKPGQVNAMKATEAMRIVSIKRQFYLA
jgi:hypothetical protein